MRKIGDQPVFPSSCEFLSGEKDYSGEIVQEDCTDYFFGLDIREYTSIKMMQSLIPVAYAESDKPCPNTMADKAVELADAIIARLERDEE